MTTRQRISLAALALELKPGAEIQLLPAGEFRARDGRPKEAPKWRLTAALAAQLIARAAARQTRFVIDFEHQTLAAASNGQPAPAAGWFKKLEWRDGQGLYAVDVEWTAAAKGMIEGGQYKYLSPVFSYNESGDVLEILMAAVTNVPALDGMQELELRAAAKFDLSDKEQPMENRILIATLSALGLAETATEAEITAAIAALKAQTPDPSKFVSVTAMNELRDQIAALRSSAAEREIGELITQALTEGKLLPAQEKWAKDLGKSNLAQLKEYIATAPAIPALGGTQSRGRAPAAAGAAGGDIVAAAKAEYAGSAARRAEFPDEADFVAFKKAEAEGRFKVHGGNAQH